MDDKDTFDDRAFCDNCGYETEVKEYREGHPPRDFRFCHVCADTFLASATAYPNQCPDDRLYKSVARIANMILDAIKKKEEPK